MDTKTSILYAALDLFSEYGYEKVSVDAIAEKVGIKGPSLYKHFHNKQDLYNSMVSLMEAQYDLNATKSRALPNTKDEFIDYIYGFLTFTLNNENVIKMRKILMMEQFSGERIAKIATKHNINYPLNNYKAVFKHLIDLGVMKPSSNIDLLAFVFISPITLLIQESDRSPEKKEEIIKNARDFFAFFIENNFN